MKKYTLLILSTIGLPSIAIGQTSNSINPPTKMFTTDIVCKDTYYALPPRSLNNSIGFITGETFHSGCSEAGNNALFTKFLETGDIVCSIQDPTYSGNYST